MKALLWVKTGVKEAYFIIQDENQPIVPGEAIAQAVSKAISL